MNAQVTSIKHKDVNGKELLYLKIEAPGKPDVLINVGQKTYDKVQNLFTLTEDKIKKEPKK